MKSLPLAYLRFGLKVDNAADEEAKKKARFERFAPNSKLDTSEEEKRKARAIRYLAVSFIFVLVFQPLKCHFS